MEIGFQDVGLSALRWFIGLSTGSIVGILLGLISQFFNPFDKPSAGLFNFLRAIPIIGLYPVVQMSFGVSEVGKIGLIAWGVVFPVWIAVRSAVGQQLLELELVLKCHNLSRWEMIKVYIAPKLIGGILIGIQISIGIAWLCVVAAELIGIYNSGFWGGGLGYKLFRAHDANNWSLLLFALAIFGALGLTTDWLWRTLTDLVFARTRGFDPRLWLRKASGT